jgi:hypothetical protein
MTTIKDLDHNPYVGRTATTPRPYAEDPKTIYTGPDDLKRHQAMWDQAAEHQKGNDELRAERLGKIEAERQAAVEQRQKADREQFEATIKAEFMAANPVATEQDWTRLKDQLIDDRMTQRTATHANEVRERLLATGVYQPF